jgi:hypothetical protein
MVLIVKTRYHINLNIKKTPRQLASPSFIPFEKNEKKENME